MNTHSKFEIGLIRSHYIGRTFIQPEIDKRALGVKIKFNTVKGAIKNREIVIVDDSIVRGTTSKQLVSLVKEAKPHKIHLRIASPPVMHPCFYGMNFPDPNELIANKFNRDVDSIREELEVDSLEYLSYEGLISCTSEKNDNYYCAACFTGKYPIEIDFSLKKNINED